MHKPNVVFRERMSSFEQKPQAECLVELFEAMYPRSDN